MRGFRVRLLAGAFVLASPLIAAAQSNESPQFSTFTAETGGGRPSLRPELDVEDTAEEREFRFQNLSKCFHLSAIRTRTILDEVVDLPNVMIDWTAGIMNPRRDAGEVQSLRDAEQGSILSRVFSTSVLEASPHPWDDLVNQVIRREQRYFSKFQDSSLATIGVEDGVEDVDSDALMADQRKMLFDTARKLYFGRLAAGTDDRLRDESLNVARWQPVDYAVAPALLAGYLYVRGWEKKFDMLGFKCGLQLEPIRRILERFEGSHNDLVGAASMELGLGDFPVKAIVSVGIQDGDPLFDFVGFGTSVGKAKQVVRQELGVEEDQ